jgi:hypothetical protein
MPVVNGTVATLRFFGDDLLPDELTSLLGRAPTESETRGDEWLRPNGTTRIAKCGSWRLSAADREPGNLDAQIAELLSGLSNDLTVWADLTTRFRADVFCGLFLDEGNEGISLSPHTLSMLGARNLELDLDIYSGSDDEE